MTVETGSITKGIVVKLLEYGAIIRLEGGDMGLVHISEIADAYVQDIRDYLAADDEVMVKVLRLNPKGKYELSLKQANSPCARKEDKPLAAASASPRPQRPAAPTAQREHHPPAPATFEDKLSHYMKESEQRLGDLKRNVEGKRRRR